MSIQWEMEDGKWKMSTGLEASAGGWHVTG